MGKKNTRSALRAKFLPLNRGTCIGLVLLLLVSRLALAEGELFQPVPSVPPQAAPGGHGEPAWLQAWADDATALLGTAMPTGELAAGVEGQRQLADGEDSGRTVDTRGCVGGEAVKLAGPPATLLLMLQGLLCIGLIRGRRKWAVALLAVVAMGRAGLGALPQLIGLSKTQAVSATPPAQPAPRLAARPALPSTSAELSYAGLLRRLDGESASGGLATLLARAAQEPATRFTPNGLVAGSFVQAVLDTQGPATALGDHVAFTPSEGRSSIPLQTVSFALFARPPPIPERDATVCIVL